MYAAMWSEHCSYKSSKVHLRTCRPRVRGVLVGPGQDAGAVDVGDGLAVVFKMESHSHPSASSRTRAPRRGSAASSATSSRWARGPIALLDPLRFGPLTEERNRWLFEGVVAGIGGYGNCIGVPDRRRRGRTSPTPHSREPERQRDVRRHRAEPTDLVTSAREVHEGSVLVLFGAATGRDGIGGVSVLASAHARGRRGREPSERPDRRPVRRQAADRGLARDGRARSARGAPGPRRRRVSPAR